MHWGHSGGVWQWSTLKNHRSHGWIAWFSSELLLPLFVTTLVSVGSPMAWSSSMVASMHLRIYSFQYFFQNERIKDLVDLYLID